MSLRCAGTIAVGSFEVIVDVEVGRGETVALVGPNGAGKTTVLNAIAGLVGVDAGRITVDGATWDDGTSFVAPADRSVGAVFQTYRLFAHLDVRENVAFGLRARGMDRARARSAAESALERFGVRDLAGRRPAELSGGQSQRVALARALVTQPAVLLLDEPMAALDASARGAVRHELAGWLGAVDACRLLVTHDPVDAHALADRVVVLEGGRITQRGTMDELAAAPASPYVADLIGTNFLRGTLRGGELEVLGGGALRIGAHAAADGPVIASIRPAAVALHRARPEGSPRNVWSTTVAGVDASDGRVRVRLDAPFRVVAEVTGPGFAALDVGVGDVVWASVKASEIGVVADA